MKQHETTSQKHHKKHAVAGYCLRPMPQAVTLDVPAELIKAPKSKLHGGVEMFETFGF
jgi:hypothetical protein